MISKTQPKLDSSSRAHGELPSSDQNLIPQRNDNFNLRNKIVQAKFAVIDTNNLIKHIKYESPINHLQKTLKLLLLEGNPAEAAYGKHILNKHTLFETEQQVATFMDFFRQQIVSAETNIKITIGNEVAIKFNIHDRSMTLYVRSEPFLSWKQLGSIENDRLGQILKIFKVQIENINNYGHISFFGENIKHSLNNFNLSSQENPYRAICLGCDSTKTNIKNLALQQAQHCNNSQQATIIDGPITVTGLLTISQIFTINPKFTGDISTGIQSKVHYISTQVANNNKVKLELYGEGFGGCTAMATYHYLQLLLEVYSKGLDPFLEENHKNIEKLLPAGTKLQTLISIIQKLNYDTINEIKNLTLNVLDKGLAIDYVLILLDPGLHGPKLEAHVTNLAKPYGNNSHVYIALVNSAFEKDTIRDMSHLKVSEPDYFSVIVVNTETNIDQSAKSPTSLAYQLVGKILENHKNSIELPQLKDNLPNSMSTPKRQAIYQIYTSSSYIEGLTKFGGFLSDKEKIIPIKRPHGNTFAWYTFETKFPTTTYHNNDSLIYAMQMPPGFTRKTIFTQDNILAQLKNIPEQYIIKQICPHYDIEYLSTYNIQQISTALKSKTEKDEAETPVTKTIPNTTLRNIATQIYEKLTSDDIPPLDPILAASILVSRQTSNSVQTLSPTSSKSIMSSTNFYNFFIIIHDKPPVCISPEGTILLNDKAYYDGDTRFIYMENNYYVRLEKVGNLLEEQIKHNTNNDNEFKEERINNIKDERDRNIIYNLSQLALEYTINNLTKFKEKFPKIGQNLERAYDPRFNKQIAMEADDLDCIRNYYIENNLHFFEEEEIFKQDNKGYQELLNTLYKKNDQYDNYIEQLNT